MRNTKIKDTMRDTCIAELVNSWYQILVSMEGKGKHRAQAHV